ncbi:hypothetical protein MTR67_049358 [Solanum verrucosum]|uniref:Uncharacterized protein n=1 Tax=Solanum verrucosum TaxID=315347 RepID=A0AAF0UZJ5_SOLVR|nr:hypothetical protein MTR67_049358 [Solanum verrucosum]
MTEAATVSSIPLATVTDVEFQDGFLQTDPLLQFGSYNGAEPNNDVLLNEGKRPNLTPALAGTTLEMQKTALAAEVVMLNEDSPTDSAELKIGNRSKRDLDAENLNLHHEKM